MPRDCRDVHTRVTGLLDRRGLELVRPEPPQLSRRAVKTIGTASIIRINPRLAAGLDIDPHTQRSRMSGILRPASSTPDGVSLPLTDTVPRIQLISLDRKC
ncbi:hypothetical protein GGE56_007599 [Rhizobium leguminosarum]|nr:hypothetical protein [Rhizobium leguminosarum]MBB5262680.1 hypothetical protein [Rhizobium leguminosarum]MBB6299240.1 hypothetical protein [Rhizobium leguminosarum]